MTSSQKKGEERYTDGPDPRKLHTCWVTCKYWRYPPHSNILQNNPSMRKNNDHKMGRHERSKTATILATIRATISATILRDDFFCRPNTAPEQVANSLAEFAHRGKNKFSRQFLNLFFTKGIKAKKNKSQNRPSNMSCKKIYRRETPISAPFAVVSACVFSSGPRLDPAPGTRHPAPGTRHLAPGTRHPAPGARRLAPGTHHLAPGTWHPAPGTRHPAPGTNRIYLRCPTLLKARLDCLAYVWECAG